jgi:hypothetical protein
MGADQDQVVKTLMAVLVAGAATAALRVMGEPVPARLTAVPRAVTAEPAVGLVLVVTAVAAMVALVAVPRVAAETVGLAAEVVKVVRELSLAQWAAQVEPVVQAVPEVKAATAAQAAQAVMVAGVAPAVLLVTRSRWVTREPALPAGRAVTRVAVATVVTQQPVWRAPGDWAGRAGSAVMEAAPPSGRPAVRGAMAV